MIIKQLNDLLEQKQYDDFFESLPEVISELNEEERQELLINIIDYHYDQKLFSRFKKAFDLIIGAKLNLNFNIDHWAPTFLSLVVLRVPSKQIFHYFLRKGADINFIGDVLAYEEGESFEWEKKHLLFGRFQTCLDFIQIKLNDMLTSDYYYDVPKKKIDEDWREITEDEGDITLSTREYLYLHEQAEYLSDLVNTDKLKDYIISIGGKSFEELEQRKEDLLNK